MSYTKKLLIILIVPLIFAQLFSGNAEKANSELATESLKADLTADFADVDSLVDYDEIERRFAEIRKEMSQPNIREDDIRRGWYLATRDERRYGTPESWIFVEAGPNSKWISANFFDEGEIIDSRRLCENTAGTYKASCLDSTDDDCEYVEESACLCAYGSKWNDEQGCIQVTERGSYVAINAEELSNGWYFGLPNQKKLNTPLDWSWYEEGRKSLWKQNN